LTQLKSEFERDRRNRDDSVQREMRKIRIRDKKELI